MYEPSCRHEVVHSGRFPDTRWSLVAAAGDTRHPHGRDAMEDLCRLYWYPVYAFIRRGGANTDTAEDRTQGFFAHLLEEKAWRSADPERSRRLAACLTGNGDTTPYRQLAVELGMTAPAIRVAIHRMRKRFGTILRREVARTVTDPRSVDDELRYLFSCLGR